MTKPIAKKTEGGAEKAKGPEALDHDQPITGGSYTRDEEGKLFRTGGTKPAERPLSHRKEKE